MGFRKMERACPFQHFFRFGERVVWKITVCPLERHFCYIHDHFNAKTVRKIGYPYLLTKRWPSATFLCTISFDRLPHDCRRRLSSRWCVRASGDIHKLIQSIECQRYPCKGKGQFLGSTRQHDPSKDKNIDIYTIMY